MVSGRGRQHRWVDCGLQRRIHSQGELGIHDNRGQHISRDGEADRGVAGSPQGTHDHSCHPPCPDDLVERVRRSLESDSLRRNCRARGRGESGRRRRGRPCRSRESFVRRRLVPIERAQTRAASQPGTASSNGWERTVIGLWLPGRAVGLVAVVNGVGLVYSVAIDEEHRRQGLAQRVMHAANSWAADAGARTMSLQVVGTNDAARALYDTLGYERLYSYHYLQRPAGQ